MATRKLLLWFEKRRKTKTLNLAQQQISLSMSTVGELDVALRAFSDGRRVEMNDAIQRLFRREDEIDGLRRNVLEELAKSDLPNAYREDLKRLVSYLDLFADQVKDSARSLKVLQWPLFPKNIMEQYLKISQDLVEGVKKLGECIETLGIAPVMVKEKAQQVAFYEDKIDKEYLETKVLFIKHSKELEPAILMNLRELLDFLERSADTCIRTADYIRMLSVSSLIA